MCENAAQKVEGLGGNFVFTLPASWVAHTTLKFMGSSCFLLPCILRSHQAALGSGFDQLHMT